MLVDLTSRRHCSLKSIWFVVCKSFQFAKMNMSKATWRKCRKTNEETLEKFFRQRISRYFFRCFLTLEVPARNDFCTKEKKSGIRALLIQTAQPKKKKTDIWFVVFYRLYLTFLCYRLRTRPWGLTASESDNNETDYNLKIGIWPIYYTHCVYLCTWMYTWATQSCLQSVNKKVFCPI